MEKLTLINAVTELIVSQDLTVETVNVLAALDPDTLTIVVDDLAEAAMAGEGDTHRRAALAIVGLIEDHGYRLTPPVQS